MLQLRPSCENCDKALPVNSTEAMICTFECTFCKDCVEKILENVCPNCGGGFERRPVRPIRHLESNPPSSDRVYKPVVMAEFKRSYADIKKVKPENR